MSDKSISPAISINWCQSLLQVHV